MISSRRNNPATTTDQPGRLWWAWWRTVTVAEAVGFAAPAVVGATLATAGDAVMAAALVAAGLIEGAALGVGQAAVLRRVLPGLPVGRFVAVTALGAALAYAVAMVPVLLAPLLGTVVLLPVWAITLLGLVLGIVLLASIGTAQWLVLRQVAAGTAWWIPATAAAWTLGLLAFFAVAPPLWQPGQPLVLLAMIGVLGGLVMAAVVAAVTGWAAVRLAAQIRRR